MKVDQIRSNQRKVRTSSYFKDSSYIERSRVYQSTLFKKYSRWLADAVKEKARIVKLLADEYPQEYLELVREKKGDMDYALRWKDRKL